MDPTPWRWITAAAGALTIASATFAVGAAVTSSDDDGGADVTSGGGTTAGGPAEEVSISGFVFQPAELSVAVGSTVRWTNDESQTHSVRSADGTLASDDLAEGDTYSVTLDTTGTIDYVCGIHDFMSGSITVSP